MTRQQENELIAKGYNLDNTPNSHSEALCLAKRYRSMGYYARVAEYATMVKGYHNYGVWWKRK